MGTFCCSCLSCPPKDTLRDISDKVAYGIAPFHRIVTKIFTDNFYQYILLHEMIESCTKRRMLLAITLLGSLTILVLIVESHWTDSTTNKSHLDIVEHNISHTSTGGYEITSCQPCTASNIDNINNKSSITCCDKSKWLIERKFLIFEGIMFGSAILSCTSVFLRENILRRRVIRKVARQLRASV